MGYFWNNHDILFFQFFLRSVFHADYDGVSVLEDKDYPFFVR